jgi:hypothetical protein
LTVVVDHDSRPAGVGRPGRDKATVKKFFNELGRSRTLKIRLVSADAASWIGDVVRSRCLNAKLTMDQFHVVQWATDALDVVRRQVWNDARRAGQTAVAKELKGARYALWRNPEDLSVRQAAKLADIARTNRRLYRAYLLKMRRPGKHPPPGVARPPALPARSRQGQHRRARRSGGVALDVGGAVLVLVRRSKAGAEPLDDRVGPGQLKGATEREAPAPCGETQTHCHGSVGHVSFIGTTGPLRQSRGMVTRCHVLGRRSPRR